MCVCACLGWCVCVCFRVGGWVFRVCGVCTYVCLWCVHMICKVVLTHRHACGGQSLTSSEQVFFSIFLFSYCFRHYPHSVSLNLDLLIPDRNVVVPASLCLCLFTPSLSPTDCLPHTDALPRLVFICACAKFKSSYCAASTNGPPIQNLQT